MSALGVPGAVRGARGWVRRHVGRRPRQSGAGPPQLRVIVLLAAVLGLGNADTATVGALAGELEPALHIGNAGIGLLVTVSTAVGAIAAIPVGILADRIRRTRMLWVAVLAWCAAMVASGAATSFGMLLAVRLVLGAVLAVVGPVVASLAGDLFPGAERGRAYGYILTGELVGTGIGFLVSGDLAILSWRIAFAWLAVPGVVLAWSLRRFLPEPARGGHSVPGAAGSTAGSAADSDAPGAAVTGPEGPGREVTGPARADGRGRRPDADPRAHLVLDRDPTGRSVWWAVRYVLAIPTNRVLIVASALGYFFLQGLQAFAVVFMRGRFGLSQAGASTLLVVLGAGAIAGVLVSGRVADAAARRGWASARPVAAGAAFVLAVASFVPALLTRDLRVAAPLIFLAAAALGAANPPLDAARLDIMHSRLWGRAESVRTFLRTSLQAVAPLLFGYVSTQLGAPAAGFGQPAGAQPQHAAGLDHTFLIMLVPLLASAVLLLAYARRTYPRDVATAVASERATAGPSRADRPGGRAG